MVKATSVSHAMPRAKAAPVASATPAAPKKVKAAAKPKAPKAVKSPAPAKAVKPPASAKAVKPAKAAAKPKVKAPPKPKEPTVRRPVNAETVDQEFQETLDWLENEVQKMKAENRPGIRSWRQVMKMVTKIRGHSARVCRGKRKTHRAVNKNSGFMKPVLISDAMAAFVGVKKGSTMSRMDCTKAICEYVKSKTGAHTRDLQNPANRREILPDAKLKALLGPTEDGVPMTYPMIQKLVQKHFTAVEGAPAAAAAAPKVVKAKAKAKPVAVAAPPTDSYAEFDEEEYDQ